MPIFANRPDTAANAWEPEAADGRLAHTAGADESAVFTSDLSVSEYVLLGEAGFEPLGFVIGSSIYHVGLQVGRWSQNQELQVLTQAMYNARELAMARMQAEADHLGADGIVGVNCGCRCTPGVRVPGVRRDWDRGAAPDPAGGAQGTRRPRVHLGSVRAGLLPAARRRRGAGGLRARHLRLPRRAPGRYAVAAPGRPEPGDAAVHPGCLRGQGTRAVTDAGGGDGGQSRRASWGDGRGDTTMSGASTRPSSMRRVRPSAG